MPPTDMPIQAVYKAAATGRLFLRRLLLKAFWLFLAVPFAPHCRKGQAGRGLFLCLDFLLPLIVPERRSFAGRLYLPRL